MESPWEFGERAANLLQEAIRLSQHHCGDKTELDYWMSVSEKHKMQWVDGLAFSVERMRHPAEA